MPEKIVRSAPLPPFGLPKALVAVCTPARLSCSKVERREYSHRLAVIREVPVEPERSF